MFKCYVKDLNTLKIFLRLNDTEYVDMLLNKGSSTIISNSTAVFGCYSLVTEATTVFTPIEFRLPTKVLKNLACEGYFYVDNDLESVTVSFFTGNDVKRASVTFIRQNIFVDSYQHKLNLLANTKNYGKSFRIGELNKLCKISKNSGGIITANNGVIGSTLSNRGRIFYVPTDDKLAKQKFSVTATGLSILLSLTNEIHNIENYLCVSKSNLAVLVTKSNSSSNDEYQLLEMAKAKYRCKVDITSVVSFLKNIDIKVKSLELDLEKRVCIFDESHMHYEIPFSVTDIEKSPVAELDTIIIPVALLNEIYSGIDMEFLIERKRNFTKISKENTFIYF